MQGITRVGMAAAVILGAFLALDAPTLRAQSKDPLVGTWDLDIHKSTFAGAPPIKRTMMFEAVPDGLKQEISTTTGGLADVTYHLTYTARFDGKDYPADVASSLDTVSIKRIDPRTVERVGKVKGQVVQTETYSVSSDGHMLTVTQQGRNNGVPFNSTQIFERE